MQFFNLATLATAMLVTVVSGQNTNQQAALDAHNSARNDVGVTPLVWDDSLASEAQEWADHLVDLGQLEHSGTDGEGENLYMQSGTDSAWVNAVDAWVDEKSKYNGEAISETNYLTFGHYSKCSEEEKRT